MVSKGGVPKGRIIPVYLTDEGDVQLEAVEREVMIPTLKKFVTEEALEKYKAGRAS